MEKSVDKSLTLISCKNGKDVLGYVARLDLISRSCDLTMDAIGK